MRVQLPRPGAVAYTLTRGPPHEVEAVDTTWECGVAEISVNR